MGIGVLAAGVTGIGAALGSIVIYGLGAHRICGYGMRRR